MFEVQRVGLVWSRDFTEPTYRNDKTYAVIVMDLCSQRTLGTSVSNILQVHRLQQALDEACRLRKQLLAESVIFQSDHQSQFNANSFRFEVVKRNFAQCMVGVGYCFYYIPTESFWSPVRTELHLHKLYDAFH